MQRISVVLGVLVLAACAPDTAPMGEERGPCYPNSTCNEGLTCLSDLCVSNDEETEDSHSGETSSPDSSTSGGGGSEEYCAEYYIEYCNGEPIACLEGFIWCREERGAEYCDAVREGCDLTGAMECAMEPYVACFDEPSDPPDPMDSGSDTTDAETGVDTGIDTDGDSCPAFGCEAFAAKMTACFPGLAGDHYQNCVEFYDACGIFECLDTTAEFIACTNNHTCDELHDGACHEAAKMSC